MGKIPCDGIQIPNSDSIVGPNGTSLGLVKSSDMQAALTAKQDVLVSATNIKTVNGASLLGSGDLTISGSGGGVSESQAIYYAIALGAA